MSLHIVHFIGPINHNSACTIRNLCLQALQSGATEIELHMSTEGGNMTAGFALYFFLKSLPLPLTTHNMGSVESVGVVIFLAGAKALRLPGHPLPGPSAALGLRQPGGGRPFARVANGATASTSTPNATPASSTKPPPARRSRDDIRTNLFGNARLFDADQALAAGIIHEAVQARLPEAGATSHWWNG